MKFTLSWLKDHLDTDAPFDAIVETLTRIGLEVEHVENPAAKLKDFIIAEVLEAAPHPNADRLRVCKVNIGAAQPVQVVCGAPNARAGLKTVFSPPGTYIPGKDFTLGKGVIRGVESLGMLCSPEELQLAGESDGVFDLAADAPVGGAYAAFAGLDDPVIEIALTPNRPDAASVWGVARDLAAAGLGRLKTAPIAPVKGQAPCAVGAKLEFAPQDASLAPLFAVRLISGVKNGPSPQWLQKRLTAIGLRPINALVDITNYMTFDRGRPLHVFDADKIKGGLVVRRARAGEDFVALNGASYPLDPSMVVIADENGVQSLAGIIGGAATGCDDATVNVLLEAALWDPAKIAASGRRLNISSDARYRFERGVDPEFCLPGAELASRLILDLCGGQASDAAILGAAPAPKNPMLFLWSETRRLTGLSISPQEMAEILERLGFRVLQTDGNADRAFVQAPSWRPDVEGPADLVEEIVRIAGLDRVVATPLPPLSEGIAPPVLTLLQKRVSTGRRALAARGFLEAVTWSFIAQADARLFGGGQLSLANPIAADLSDMRPSLLPGLIRASQRNADRGMGDVALFELGQVFLGDAPEQQIWSAAGMRRGAARPMGGGRNWKDKSASVDIYDAKADLFALLASLGIAPDSVQLAAGGPAWLHPGRAATLRFGPKNIVGYFGEPHPRVLEALGAEGPICVFELNLNALPAPKARPTKARPKLELSPYMPLERDFAFVVDRATPAQDVLKAVLSADKTLIAEAALFDVYEGAGVAEDKKSMGVAIRIEPRQATLTDKDIETLTDKVIAEAQKKTGAVLRG